MDLTFYCASAIFFTIWETNQQTNCKILTWLRLGTSIREKRCSSSTSCGYLPQGWTTSEEKCQVLSNHTTWTQTCLSIHKIILLL